MEKETMRFFLEDENNDYRRYEFVTSLKNVEEFEEFSDTDPDFENFMRKMECTDAPWSGVHDCSGDEMHWGYSSYEIKDFDTAIQMWWKFFSSKDKLTKDSIIVISNHK
jgi:hypothetical protein